MALFVGVLYSFRYCKNALYIPGGGNISVFFVCHYTFNLPEVIKVFAFLYGRIRVRKKVCRPLRGSDLVIHKSGVCSGYYITRNKSEVLVHKDNVIVILIFANSDIEAVSFFYRYGI